MIPFIDIYFCISGVCIEDITWLRHDAKKIKGGKNHESTKSKASEEDQVKKQIDVFAKAFRTEDVTLMMSIYSEEFTAFDVIQPLKYEGKDVYRKSLAGSF